MRAEGTFTVASLVPVELSPAPDVVATGLPVGVSIMEKRYEGGIVGHSVTRFTAAFDQAQRVGAYVAMESFEGSLNGLAGTFNFAHAATSHGSQRTDEHFTIVPRSGTGGLAGISGTGGLAVTDEQHVIWFQYELG